MRRGFLALLLVVGLFSGASAVPGGAGEDAEALLPGDIRERSIAAGKADAYRVEVEDAPILIVVEQRGIDLVVEVLGPGEQGSRAVDASSRWGREVVLLPADAVGRHRIEVRPLTQGVPPGRYVMSVELPEAEADGARRLAAASAMSRAGQLATTGKSEALRQATEVYREAVEGWRALGERVWEAEALHAMALTERQHGELRDAADDFARALALWRELGERRREASALNGLGRTHLGIGELDAARRAFEGAHALYHDLGERFDEGEARINLCLVEQTVGAVPEALGCYEEVRSLFHELGDQSQEARILNSLGGIYNDLGQPDAALDHYGKALTRWQEAGDRLEEARTLNNIAVVYRALGEWQEALRLYGQARDVLAPLGDRIQEAALLNNIGYTYNSLGEPQRALVLLQEVLQLRKETQDRRGELICLNNIGLTQRSLGDLDSALAYHRQALALATELDDPRQEAVTRLLLAEVLLDRADSAAALRELDSAQTLLAETESRRGAAMALHLRGRVLALAGKPEEALPILQDTLARRRALRDRAGEVETLHALAAVERTLGRRDEARSHAEEAIARVEEMRTGFVSPGLRAAFLATQRRAYALLIDLLMDRHTADPKKGYGREAFAVSEQARARSLLDALWSGNAFHAGGAVPAELLEQRRSLRYRLGVKTEQQLRQINPGSEKAEALEREIEALLTRLDSVEAEIHRLAPREAALAQPPTLGVQEIAGLLDPGTLLLEYSLGKERSYLWAVGADRSFHSFVLPAQREIEDLGRRVYEDLRTVEAGAAGGSDAAESLARILLEPVWSEAARSQRLVVVPDAALHVLPFSALPVPRPGQGWKASGSREPLLDQQEVVYLPSAATLAVERQRLAQRPVAPKGVAVLADPIFAADDPRLAGTSVASRQASVHRDGQQVFERLPSSREEAKAIAGLAPAGGVWTALDLKANRDAVLSGELRAYRVVHFATHAIADTRNPERSGLVLSLVDAAGRPREGFLGLPDIYELDLGADLVVLSGCQTALGKEVRGEGLMGLTRGFLYAGVPRVVASLWRVQDRTTADLMSRFYERLWRGGLSPAAALREAQRSLRRSNPRYRDPYAWAGFVLQGDWR